MTDENNVAGYADLLKRHIEKEDAVCYSFALRMLSDEDKKQIDEETKQFEKVAEKNDNCGRYLCWLKSRCL